MEIDVKEQREGDSQLRLAYFSPLPPARSGIADYSAELLPHLSQHATITLFNCNLPNSQDSRHPSLPSTPHPTLPTRYPLAAYPSMRWQFDLALYHMGNSEHHQAIYHTLVRYPGVVIVHDVYIHQLLAHATVGQGNYAAYSREMAFAAGLEGIHEANVIRAGYGEHRLFEIPLTERLVRTSLGLIVHSQYAADLIQSQQPRCPVEVIPAPIAIHPIHNGRSRRHELGLAEETVIFASMGQVTQNKQANHLLRVFQQLHRENQNTFLLFIGEVLPGVNLEGTIRELGLEGAVGTIGYVDSLERFVDWIQTADVIVNLRHPTVGETSATALRGLAAGRPLVVYDHGWYHELPDAVALKVSPLDEAALLDALRTLASSAGQRQQMGEAAADYARKQHHPAQVAQHYATFLHNLIARWQQPYA